MNFYKLTHHYSLENRSILISSEMSFVDIWNIVALLQYISSDIDSSHAINEANTATFLIKYFDVGIYDPDVDDEDILVEELDLYTNWELGFADSDGKFIGGSSNSMNEYIKLYSFYQSGMYSYILELIIRDHPLFKGSAGCDVSFGMDNEIWQILFAEGIYQRDGRDGNIVQKKST